jgi:prevent-host-death family protein
MTTVNMHEAKTRLSQLVARVEAGEDVVIARAGKPVAKLTSVSAPERAPFGFARGTARIVGDVNDPLPNEVLESFYGGPIASSGPPSRAHRRSRR